jgi:hypothetical protein
MATIPDQPDKQSHPSAQKKGKSIPDNNSLATDDRGTRPYQNRRGQNQTAKGSPGDIDDGPDRDNVEIGDPVPEDDRTIRTGGETGEDEDLPDDQGDIEGGGRQH